MIYTSSTGAPNVEKKLSEFVVSTTETPKFGLTQHQSFNSVVFIRFYVVVLRRFVF